MPVLNPNLSTRAFCALCILAGLLAQGCQEKAQKKTAPTVLQHDMLTQIDRWAVTVPNDQAVEGAVITQRVLYDYHFATGTDRLTKTGHRDLEILIRHYRGQNWQLNMKPGNASPDLYKSRIKVVESFLLSSGMSPDTVAIVDGLPGGTGLSSDNARRIRQDSLDGAGALEEGQQSIRSVSDTPLEGGF